MCVGLGGVSVFHRCVCIPPVSRGVSRCWGECVSTSIQEMLGRLLNSRVCVFVVAKCVQWRGGGALHRCGCVSARCLEQVYVWRAFN